MLFLQKKTYLKINQLDDKNAAQFSQSQRLVCAAVLKRYSSAIDVFNFSAFQLAFENQKALPAIPKVIYEAKLNFIDAIFDTLKEKHCFDAGVQVRRISKEEFSVEFDRKINEKLIWPDNFSLAQYFQNAIAATCACLVPSFCISKAASAIDYSFKTDGWLFLPAKQTKSGNLKVIVRLLKN